MEHAQSPTPDTADHPASSPRRLATRHRTSVLIASRLAYDRLLVASGLRTTGCLVATARTPQEALALLADRGRSVDVLLTTDFALMNGVSLAAQALLVRPELRLIVVRAASGLGLTELRSALEELDCPHVLLQSALTPARAATAVHHLVGA